MKSDGILTLQEVVPQHHVDTFAVRNIVPPTQHSRNTKTAHQYVVVLSQSGNDWKDVHQPHLVMVRSDKGHSVVSM